MAQLDLETQSGMQELADGVHALAGAAAMGIPLMLAMFSLALLGRSALLGLWALCVTLPISEGLAAYKEFRWDPKHETLQTSGGPSGDLRDFLGYNVGIWSVLLLILIIWLIWRFA